MPGYPTLTDYRTVVGFSFDNAVLDSNLKGGKAKLNNRGQPLSYAGGFSIVFPIDVNSRTFALRCWKREVNDAQERYQKIGTFLAGCTLPYFVDFQYVPNGIRVNNELYPTTRMEWVEGKTLCKFVEQNLRKPEIFKTVADKFAEMVKVLHNYKIAHGDLQDGNILLLQNGTNIEIKLIDYDSLYVPTLRGKPDSIVGLEEYQHPIRMAGNGTFNDKIDYFSELVIYLSFRGLSEKPALWDQLKGERTEKGLLFSANDFQNPNQSNVFRELAKMSSEVQKLASALKAFCAKQSIDNLKPLENVLQPSSTRPALSPSKPKPIVPQTALDYYNQGIRLLQDNLPNYAVQQFKKAIRLNRNYKEAHYGCGLAYFQMEQFKPAEKSLEEALKIDPTYSIARNILDNIRRQNNPIYRQNISTPTPKPKKPSPTPKRNDSKEEFCKRARILYNQGELTRAQDVAEKALNLDPNYRDARILLASIQAKYSRLAETYMNKGQNDEALAAYEEVIKIGEQLG